MKCGSIVIAVFFALLTGCAPQVQDSAGKVLDNAATVVQPGVQKVWEPSPGAPPVVTQPESEKVKANKAAQ